MNDLINREQGIEAIAGAIWHYPNLNFLSDYDHAHELAEDALKRLPSVQSEPCEDAVSRKAVAGIYTSLWGIIGTIMDRGEWDDVCRTTANELPSAEPERKTGKWLIAEKDRYIVHSVQCSVCGNCISWMANYCPNCGSYNGGEG